jgi:hypothetical protein
MTQTSKIDANYKAPVGRTYANDAKVVLLRTPAAGEKIPAQAGKIIEALVVAKDNTLTIAEIVGKDEAGLGNALDKVGLETVQTPRKIWQFYKARLVREGYISIS